jgi:DNA-binding transcriptional regulator YiaG
MKYKSEIYEVVHNDAVEMFEIGAISKAEMKKFDKMCLVKEKETAYTVDLTKKAFFPLETFAENQ